MSACGRGRRAAPRLFALVSAFLGFVALAPPASAQTQAPDYYREPGLYPGRDYVNQHFAEYIDPFTGGLKLSYVDLFIPGNGGLDIRIQRSYTVPQGKPPALRPNPYGLGWSMHFGRVLKSANANFCIDTNAQSTLDNPVLELADGTRKLFMNAAGYFGSGAVNWITQDYWLGRCDSGGNLTVFSPQGEAYPWALPPTKAAARRTSSFAMSRGSPTATATGSPSATAACRSSPCSKGFRQATGDRSISPTRARAPPRGSVR
jgi:hypothetical protein